MGRLNRWAELGRRGLWLWSLADAVFFRSCEFGPRFHQIAQGDCAVLPANFVISGTLGEFQTFVCKLVVGSRPAQCVWHVEPAI